METLKIRVERKTSFSGITYYSLYLNDRFEVLDSDLEKINEKIATAKRVFESGEHIPEVILSEEVNRNE